ncbi:MAG TPA: hypothetical protein VM096_06265 [Vicinamibacterales bacterium]|nr:hypothetical protein [Vicinamibacterales bacterium]
MKSVFLLSPAYCGGRRASILLNPKSPAVTSCALRSGTLSLGGAFTFMSGLYFRGKLSYAQRFGEALVITPTRGLQDPERPFTLALLREFAVGDVSLDNPEYRSALERDVAALSKRIGNKAQVVLLGSVASGKYVDVLLPILGDRLRYPTSFVGRGDMSRGGLLLRSAANGQELEYGPLTAGVRPRGPRPPKLDPLTRVGPSAVAVSWDHETEPPRTRAARGIIEPALSAGTPGAKGLGAVVDIRLRPRPRVHGRPRS